jgi:cellulose synthase/poly-beta-1,6-N-acetylglucosamine synthase-like glycosyltransferase
MSMSGSQTRDYYRRMAAQAGTQFVRLDPEAAADPDYQPVNPLAARLLSDRVCRQFGIVGISYEGGVVTVAGSDPFDQTARQVAASITGRDVRMVVAEPDEITAATSQVFEAGSPGEQGAGFSGGVAVPPASTLFPRDDLTSDVDPGYAAEPAFSLVPGRLGDMLVRRGLATEEQIQGALGEQQRTGSRLGDVLVSAGIVDDRDLVSVLAEQYQVPVVDLADYTPEDEALAILPEPVARRLRVVPLAVEGDTLYVAAADVLDDDTVAALREHTPLELRAFFATRSSIDELLQRVYRDVYAHIATSDLIERFPEESASRVVTGPQRFFFIAVLVIFLGFLVFFPVQTLVVAISISSAFYLAASIYRFKLTYDSLGHQYEIAVTDEEVAALDERDLPMYTILVPLYREASVVPRLVAGISGLDYPKTKLDVRLLCEEDDDETIPAIQALNLPPHFSLVVVPDAQPKTKPKACNYGLLQAQGEYIVIYDAEDRPDPDQLKKIIVAFGKADPAVTCIQAKLNYFNQEQNLLTRWFSTEYSMWFELFLPGLDAADAPIPLGGTSNHFVKERLVELAGWDPFNVTEDADLGIRLFKRGYKTAIIDSVTLEEANSDLANWIRQRSRWIKGYIQTWLVHMRNPLKLLSEIGPRAFISFQLVVGATFIFLLNPIFWALTTLFFFTQAGWIQDLFPGFVFYAAAFQLFIGNFVFMYLNVAGTVRRGYFGLAKYALLSPLYWGLMSIAALKGFFQLFYRPFYWEKTVHGLDQG